MDEGRLIFHGTSQDLVAYGHDESLAGDSAIERGYGAVLARNRQRRRG